MHFSHDTAPLGPQTLYAEVERLGAAYPALSARTLGTSILGRPIPLLLVGCGRQKRLYVGAHHGTEWLTARLLLYFLEELLSAAARGERPYGLDLGFLFSHRTLCFVPMLNPDGVAVHLGEGDEDPLAERRCRMAAGDFSHWQANARGVDLNHNYDAGFAAYKSVEATLGITGGAPTRYSGPYPESEPETAALASFVRATRPRLILTLHTQGEEIYFAGGEGVHTTARRMALLSGYRVASPEGAAAYGGLTDWAGGVLGIPSFTLECGKGENPLPPCDAVPIYHRLSRLFFESITM
ncbi:MAG: gamma-D-glutamyl-meso-diaminopimelate peptidase [Clostridia bacterium]|nr:gamma-D-glutamyl-meso-diaminopimelate peptidase [Clostridia bacterium]